MSASLKFGRTIPAEVPNETTKVEFGHTLFEKSLHLNVPMFVDDKNATIDATEVGGGEMFGNMEIR